MSTLDVLAGLTPPPTLQAPEIGFVLYDARNDPQAPDFLPYIWRRMQKDDLVDYYFPGQKDTGYATFVRMMSGDANVALVTVPDDSHQWDKTITGFISWTPLHLGAAEMIVAGFIFFREFWDHKTTDQAARGAFDLWFRNTSAENVIGVCPSDHIVALRYNRRIGLKEIGRIPNGHLFKGKVCDAVLVCITRAEWEKR